MWKTESWCKMGRREQQGPKQVLKTTAPNYATNDNFIGVAAGFGFHGKPKKCTQPDKTNLTSTTAALVDATPACANRLGGHDKHYKRIANHDPTHPTPHPTPIIVQQPRNDKRQTLENSMITRLRKTNAKPHRSKFPKQNQPRQQQKDEIHAKICLR